MAKLHNLGFPRIGKHRELKRALEAYWNTDIEQQEFTKQITQVREQHYSAFNLLDYAQVGDFSLYDHVLDASFLFGNVPDRAKVDNTVENDVDAYFRIARGRAKQNDCCATHAGEMTKWFDTNYHYIVPEFSSSTVFTLNCESLISEIRTVRSRGFDVKPVIIGPLTYLYLGKAIDNSNKLELLEPLLKEYKLLLQTLAKQGVEWVQIDEPALVTELSDEWQFAYKYAFEYLNDSGVKLLLTTYFGDLAKNLKLACALPVAGVHIDAIRAPHEVEILAAKLNANQVLSVGIVDGRNIWRTDLNRALALLKPIAEIKRNNLWLAPACSLLHCPVDVTIEQNILPEIRPWLAFAEQKLEELEILKKALANTPSNSVFEALQNNQNIIAARKASTLATNLSVQQALSQIQQSWLTRSDPYKVRINAQQALLNLPRFPTTTIGSFPQTAEIRKTRREFINGDITDVAYENALKAQIADCIQQQESLGLDVLVHGESERNDMVEYFAAFLNGVLTTQFGWVQSYGSRCVKPPVIYGDVSRASSMTIHWTKYAQSLTQKPVKGMLTGPVTILNWSFVRDDQARSLTTKQIALAVRDEVIELESIGTKIIQIDEAALREGLPLKKSEWQTYLNWAVDSFKLCSSSVASTTQIHTHMCYSQFNDILPDIQRMDADVITIETSRSNMKLLDAFTQFNYNNDIGPGVYDIHSQNIPTTEAIKALILTASEKVPARQLWINPDCGLKTREWKEVIPALRNLVEAAKQLRVDTLSA